MTNSPNISRRVLLSSLGASAMILNSNTDSHALFNQMRTKLNQHGRLGRSVVLSDTYTVSPNKASILEAANAFRSSVGSLAEVLEELTLAPERNSIDGHYQVQHQRAAQPTRFGRNAFNQTYFNRFVGPTYIYDTTSPVSQQNFIRSVRSNVSLHSPASLAVHNLLNRAPITFFGEFARYYNRSHDYLFPGHTTDWRRFASAAELRSPITPISFGGVHRVGFWRVLGDLLWVGLSVFVPWVNTSTHFRSIFQNVWSLIVEEVVPHVFGSERQLVDESHADSAPEGFRSGNGEISYEAFRTPSGRTVLYSRETWHIEGGFADLVPERGNNRPGQFNMLAVQQGNDLHAKFVTEYAD